MAGPIEPLVVFLVIGLLIGALAGYLTRPESAEIKLGPIEHRSEAATRSRTAAGR